MRYRNLGQWGLRVSAVSLGSWLTYGGTVGEQAAVECIRRAHELGINLFDTANGYRRGGAEEVVGRALAPFPRESFVLATKVFLAMGDGPNDRGLSRKHVYEQCHASLRRLGLDYIDLYQCHRFDPHTPIEETARVMDDLVRAGRILYWGVSEWTAEQISTVVELCREEGWAVPVSNQPQYSALWRRIENEVLPESEELGLGNVVWSPLAMGILTGKYTSVDDVPPESRAATDGRMFMGDYFTQEVLDAVKELRPVAEGAGVTLGQLALAWCLRQPGVSSVIVGATRVEQVEENARAADLDLGDDVFEAVDDLLGPFAAS